MNARARFAPDDDPRPPIPLRSAKSPSTKPAGERSRKSGTRVEAIGKIVRDLRRDRMTLNELSKRSGVSMGLLSRLENGTGNPSFRVLHSVADALGVHVSVLFRGDERPQYRLVRPDDRLRVRLPTSVTDYEILVPEVNGDLLVYLWRVPRGFSGEPHRGSHTGDEFIYLMSGTLEVHVASEVYRLDVGDALTFDAAKPHWLRNPGRQSADLLVVMSPVDMAASPDWREGR